MLSSALRLLYWTVAMLHSSSYPDFISGRIQCMTCSFLFLQKMYEKIKLHLVSDYLRDKNILLMKGREMNQAFLDLSSQLCRTQDPANRQTPQETSNELKGLSGEMARRRAPKITCRRTKAFTCTETSLIRVSKVDRGYVLNKVTHEEKGKCRNREMKHYSKQYFFQINVCLTL